MATIIYMAYILREADYLLDELLPEVPAISIDGAKAVGKTATAARRCQSILKLDDPTVRRIAEQTPGYLQSLTHPVLLDEWQHSPTLWDKVRHIVDAKVPSGSYLLSGSAAPTTPSTHSGAGRILRIRLRPMGWTERSYPVGSVSISQLFNADSLIDITGQSQVGVAEYADEIVRSGFPGIREFSARQRARFLRDYIAHIVDYDMEDLGVKIRRPESLFAWFRAYSGATATTSSYETIRDAATAGQVDKPAAQTTITYRDALAKLWLLDPLPAWSPSGNQLNRLAKAPKHMVADPALAASVLDITIADLLVGQGSVGAKIFIPKTGSMFGRLFETLAVLSVQALATRGEYQVSHLRTKAGEREVDIILTAPGRKVIGIEVKSAFDATDNDCRHLLWLRRSLGESFRAGIVLTTGTHAYRRKDGIIVCPLALLRY